MKIQFEQEDTKNNTGAMYFLIQEMQSILDQVEIKSTSTLEEELIKSWNELKVDTDSLKKQQLAWEKAKVERDRDESSLKSREDLLKAIESAIQDNNKANN